VAPRGAPWRGDGGLRGGAARAGIEGGGGQRGGVRRCEGDGI